MIKMAEKKQMLDMLKEMKEEDKRDLFKLFKDVVGDELEEKKEEEEEEKVVELGEKRKENEIKKQVIDRANEIYSTDRPYILTDEKGKKYLDKVWLKEYILVNYPAVCVSGTLFFYRNGTYVKEKIGEPEQIAEQELMRFSSKSNIQDIVYRWKNTRSIQAEPEDLNKFEDKYINFKNGMLDLDTGELLDHSPEFLSTNQWNADYDPENFNKIEGSKFKQFLDFVLPNEKEQQVLAMADALALTNITYGRRNILIKNGPSGSGKSTESNLTINNIGNTESIASIQLNELNQPYQLAELYGKTANVIGDLDEGVIKQLGKLKNLTGNDMIQGARKYGHPMYFRNKATFIINSNGLPEIVSRDTSEAIYQRMIIVDFNREIPKENRDPQLERKIIKEETDIIAAWLVIGIKMLKDHNWEIPIEKEMEQKLESYRHSNNPLFQFFNEEIEFTDNEEDILPTKVLLEKYKVFLSDYGYNDNISINTLKNKIQRTFTDKDITTNRKFYDGKQQSCFIGMKFQDGTNNEEVKFNTNIPF